MEGPADPPTPGPTKGVGRLKTIPTNQRDSLGSVKGGPGVEGEETREAREEGKQVQMEIEIETINLLITKVDNH